MTVGSSCNKFRMNGFGMTAAHPLILNLLKDERMGGLTPHPLLTPPSPIR